MNTAIMSSTGLRTLLRSLVVLSGALLVGACTAPQTALPPAALEPPSQQLRAGDIIQVSFPRASSLNTQQQIRRDGKINLGLVGDVQAANLTPAELEKQLEEKFAAQLVSKEVRVTLVSSAFTIYVSGAVLKPGKLNPDRDLTPFQAVMEAGGFDPVKANPKEVVIVREDGRRFIVDLRAFLEGKQVEQPLLHANDTVYVPERRSIF